MDIQRNTNQLAQEAFNVWISVTSTKLLNRSKSCNWDHAIGLVAIRRTVTKRNVLFGPEFRASLFDGSPQCNLFPGHHFNAYITFQLHASHEVPFSFVHVYSLLCAEH